MNQVVVLGNGISGKGAIQLLKQKQENAILIKNFEKSMQFFEKSADKIGSVITSPGIKLSHDFIELMKKNNIKIISELEFAYQNCEAKNNLVVITGTNGKTTTVMMTKHILNKFSKTFAVGNNGKCFSSCIHDIKKDNNVVVEVSSYQLEYTNTIKPKIAVFLNFSEDHIERHESLENYFDCKMKIFQNQTNADYAIINADCDELIERIKKKIISSQMYYVSTKKVVKGIYLIEDTIYFNDGTNIYVIGDIKPLNLIGDHNKSNCMVAILTSILLGNDIQKTYNNALNYKFEKHRLMHVSTINNVRYINDSKSTNVDSTICAINSFDQNIILLVGGYDKCLNYDKLFEKVKEDKVKKLILFGKCGKRLYKNNKSNKIVYEQTMHNAVTKATSIAQGGDIVLLSPGCSSYDEYQNYEQRGEMYISMIKRLKKYADNTKQKK